MAIVAPRAALAAAGDRRHVGRSGSDLLAALGLLLAATQLRAIVVAVWLAFAVGLGLGGRALIEVLQPLTIPFAVLIASAAVIWLASGRRGRLGRAFDLACVAVLPLVVIELIAMLLVRAGVAVPTAIVSILAYGWTGMWIALAAIEQRHAVAPPVAGRAARIAGALFVALALIGFASDAVDLARHLDDVRPISSGEPAPALDLPTIGPKGALGPHVSLAQTRGKITVIDFWATWCRPCLRALPHVDAFARAHPDIAVLAVDLDQPADARELFDEQHYTPTLLLDDGATSARFGVSEVPHQVVIDRAGRVRAVGRGEELDLEQVTSHL